MQSDLARESQYSHKADDSYTTFFAETDAKVSLYPAKPFSVLLTILCKEKVGASNKKLRIDFHHQPEIVAKIESKNDISSAPQGIILN